MVAIQDDTSKIHAEGIFDSDFPTNKGAKLGHVSHQTGDRQLLLMNGSLKIGIGMKGNK